MIKVENFPKLESPFTRDKETFMVTSEVAKGYEWVFEDPDVLATEKLNGTNVSIIIEDNKVKDIYNRKEYIPFISNNRPYIVEGLIASFRRGYIDLNNPGQCFGELIGEKVNKNPLEIEGHLWIPFDTYVREHLSYSSWGKYPKDYKTISDWFQNDIFSLFMRRSKNKIVKPEGVVFVQPTTGKMAKLRLDMFPWYKGKRH